MSESREIGAILVAGLIIACAIIISSILNVSVVDTSTAMPVNVTTAGTGANFYLSIAEGKVDGYSHINKFGHNPSTSGGDDIWGAGGVYDFYPDTAQAMDIVSTSAEDDVGGTGAIQVMVLGLNSSWHEVSEMVYMNGTTPVNLAHTYIRMYRAFVYEAGTNDTNMGDLSVEIQGDTTKGVFIGAEHGQTLQCIYTIPKGKTGYFIKGYVGMSTADKTSENMIFNWLMKFNNGVNGAWLVQGEIGVVNLGSGYWQYEYGVPAGGLPEKTDIRIKAISGSGTFDTVCGYDLILVDN